MLTDEEREALVKYRIEKAYGTLVEAMTAPMMVIGLWLPIVCIMLPIMLQKPC